jgi:hypothetical protein
MISWLRPVEVSLDFEDQAYELGDTIEVKARLRANRDVQVVRGYAEVVCEVRYSELDTVEVPGRMGLLNVSDSRPIFLHTTKRVVKKNRKRYVRGSIQLLADTDIGAGETLECGGRLSIRSRRPPHALDGTLKWNVQATIKLASGREVKCDRPAEVRVPWSTVQGADRNVDR